MVIFTDRLHQVPLHHIRQSFAAIFREKPLSNKSLEILLWSEFLRIIEICFYFVMTDHIHHIERPFLRKRFPLQLHFADLNALDERLLSRQLFALCCPGREYTSSSFSDNCIKTRPCFEQIALHCSTYFVSLLFIGFQWFLKIFDFFPFFN